MYALNRAQFIGHLTEDPQIRQTPSGQTVGDLNMVTVEEFVDNSGSKREIKAFHTVVVWSGLADIAQRFLKKGSQIYISGRSQTDEWDDPQTGVKKNKTRFIADNMILLDPKTPHPELPSGSSLKGSLNKGEIIGNITRDPEVRETATGLSVASFGVATNFSWKDRSGQIQEKTEFHNAVVWGKVAQESSQFLKKGRKVYLEGRWQTRSWETPDGQKRYVTEIVAQRVVALGTVNPEVGAPANASAPANVAVPQNSNPFAPASSPSTQNVNPFSPSSSNQNTPKDSVNVPPVKYESEIKPEDLPF